MFGWASSDGSFVTLMLQTHWHFPQMFSLPYVRELLLRSSNEYSLVCAGFGFHIPCECEIDQIEDTWEAMNSKNNITGVMKRLSKTFQQCWSGIGIFKKTSDRQSALLRPPRLPRQLFGLCDELVIWAMEPLSNEVRDIMSPKGQNRKVMLFLYLPWIMGKNYVSSFFFFNVSSWYAVTWGECLRFIFTLSWIIW